jgi:hypothetical protein
MDKYRNEGREIFYGTSMELAATTHPIDGQYAQAIGLAGRISELLNAARGLRLDDAVQCLEKRRSEI